MSTKPIITDFGFMSREDKNTLDNIKNAYLAKDIAQSTYLSKTDTAAAAISDSKGHTISEFFAPLSSPILTGTPTAPTPSQEDDSTRIATTAYVSQKIGNIDISAALSGKVDKVTGKGLSTNDYTTSEKNKLAGIAENAQVNVIEAVKVDNTALKITDKTVNIDLSGKVDKVTGKGLSANDYTTAEKEKLAGIAAGAQVNTVTGIKGSSETSYRTGNIEITKANIGLGSVDNTADSAKTVAKAGQLTNSINLTTTDGTNTSIAVSFNGSANTAIKLPATIKATIDGAAISATKDSKGNVITDTYLTKTAAGTTYLGISAKAASATTADSATTDSAGHTISTYFAPLSSPALTGTPTSTTPTKNDSSTKIATTAYVDRAISDVIGGAPEALDTLKEISDIIGDTKNVTGSLITQISGKQPSHAALTSISGLTTAADKMIYTTAANTYTTTTLTATGRSLISQTSTAAVRTLIGAIDSTATVAAATKDSAGNTISTHYAAKSAAISSLAVSGKVITYTRADGTTGTITTQDTVTTNTDQSVQQSNTTANTAYPILLKNGTGTGTTTTSVLFNSGVTITPSTGTVTATTFAGNATSATKATQDGSGNVITSTYLTTSAASSTYAAKTAAISSLAISGKVITWTKADGTTGTITTQDTVTTNTDQAVQQTNSTGNVAYPLIFRSTTGTTTTTAPVLFNSAITVNPSTSTITATNFAGLATKATGDSNGDNIRTTYVKSVALSGNTVTVTKGDNTTNTFTVATTNTNDAVTQTNNSANTAYPILFRTTTGTTTTTTGVYYKSTITINPSTSTITATNFAGKATSAGTADTAGNVTGTVAIANGGTGATTAATARQNLFGNAMNTAALAKYIITINDSWASGGYTTVQQLRNFMGLGDTVSYLPVANGGTGTNSLASVTVGAANKVTTTLTGTNVSDILYASIADNDYARIRVGGTATNTGYIEIATADDGNEPIYVRQYSGVFTTLTRTATILDASGNTSFPGTVTATNFSGLASKATGDKNGADITTTYALKSTAMTGADISNGIMSKTINGTTTYVPVTIPYVTCDTTAIAKVVTLANFSLVTGARVTVKFTGAGVAGNCTLNVNSTGAKPIYYRGYQVPGDALQANTTLDLVYNGTQWEIVGSFFWVS